jgi:hypothetical protein
VKGILFNLLEEVVVQEYGEDTWDEILDAAAPDGAYTSVGSYPDEEFIALVEAIPTRLDQPSTEVLRWFGSCAIPLLAARYPIFFEGHTSTTGFLLTLNDIIHAEVRKLYPDAEVPTFEFDVPVQNGHPDRRLIVGYRSRRQLCTLAEGFIEGAALQFGEHAAIEQTTCMSRGDGVCTIVCSFSQGS